MTTLFTYRHAREQTLRGLQAFEPQVGMVSVRVADVLRSLDFYVGVLGMQEILRAPGIGEDEHELVLEYPGGRGAHVMLLWNAKRSVPYEHGNASSRITIMVNDIVGALRHAIAHGAPLLIPITESDHALRCLIADPDGFGIELLQL